MKDISKLKFEVWVGGELERKTNMLGFMKLLHNWSDFFDYTEKEQIEYIDEMVKNKQQQIDANILVKLIK